MSIFEKASRLKLRFPSSKGQLSTEELWDLSLTSLDNIGKTVIRALKDAQEESLIVIKSNATTVLDLQLEILKHIIAVKQTEAEASKLRVANQQHKQLLLELKASKQMQALQNLTAEEIDAQLALLD